eukprot:scaffold197809_cov21-Tisochrysis_lutea.AAC.1
MPAEEGPSGEQAAEKDPEAPAAAAPAEEGPSEEQPAENEPQASDRPSLNVQGEEEVWKLLPVPWTPSSSPSAQLPRPKGPRRSDLEPRTSERSSVYSNGNAAPPLQPRPPPSEPPRNSSGRRRFHGTVFESPSGRWRGPVEEAERPSSNSVAHEQVAQNGVEQNGVVQNGHGPPEQQAGEKEDGPQGHLEGGDGDSREEEGEEGEAGGPVFIEHRQSSAQPIIFGNGHLEEQSCTDVPQHAPTCNNNSHALTFYNMYQQAQMTSMHKWMAALLLCFAASPWSASGYTLRACPKGKGRAGYEIVS